MARRLARITAVLLLAATAVLGFRGVFLLRATPAFPQAVGPSENYTSVGTALSKFVQHEMEDKKLPAFSIALVDRKGRKLLVKSEEHTSELQSRRDLVCRLLLEKKKKTRGIVLEDNPNGNHEQQGRGGPTDL